jgi:hypothetical protein
MKRMKPNFVFLPQPGGLIMRWFASLARFFVVFHTVLKMPHPAITMRSNRHATMMSIAQMVIASTIKRSIAKQTAFTERR